MFLQIQAAVQGLPTPASAAAGLAAATTVKGLVMADAGTPRVFSAHVTAVKAGLRTDSRQSVPIEEGVAVEVGLYAYRNATTPTSTTAWPDTTGSWQGDVLRGLMILGNFRADEASKGEGFTEMVRTVISSLRSGLSAVTEEAGALGSSQQRLEAARKRHQDIGGQVEIQLGKVEHVELGEAITRATSTKSQLEASYRSMSMLSGLSLANFLR
jgi:flagellin-like hook-associated protein FlgL